MKFLINTHHTKGPCAGLFNYVIDIIQLFYYLIKPFCVLQLTHLLISQLLEYITWKNDKKILQQYFTELPVPVFRCILNIPLN